MQKLVILLIILVLGGFSYLSYEGVYLSPGITPSISASRVNCISPCSVLFDATATQSSNTNREFHELDYAWDFDDPSSGVWDLNGKSRNKAKGAITGHVFDLDTNKDGKADVSSKRFDVTLTVSNGFEESTKTISVNVKGEPSGGWTTYCVSKSGTDTSCAPGAIAKSSIHDVPLGANTRILLKRGDSWSGFSRLNLGQGPGLISAYGPCQGQNSKGSCSNDPLISSNGEVFRFAGANDWTISNIRYQAASSLSNSVFTIAKDNENILVYRIDSNGGGIGWWGDDPSRHVGMAVVDSKFVMRDARTAAGPRPISINGKKSMILGSDFIGNEDTHVFRSKFLSRTVVSNNRLHGSGNGDHVLKIHAPFWDTTEAKIPAGTYSDYLVVSDNEIVAGKDTSWPVTFGPQNRDNSKNPGSDERVRHVVFERNFIHSKSKTDVAVHVWGEDVTIRNNIFDFSNSNEKGIAVVVDKRAEDTNAPHPSGVKIYNNAVYRSNSPSGKDFSLVNSQNSADNTEVKNNIIYGPSVSSSDFSFALSGSKITEQANIKNTNPSWINPSNGNFGLNSGSSAINSGVSVPVFDDFYSNPRPAGQFDIGPIEYQSGQPPQIPTPPQEPPNVPQPPTNPEPPSEPEEPEQSCIPSSCNQIQCKIASCLGDTCIYTNQPNGNSCSIGTCYNGICIPPNVPQPPAEPEPVSDCKDQDGDGYDDCDFGEFGDDNKKLDCNDALSQVNPGVDDDSCNGIDNDCDGRIDEEYFAPTTTCGQGICSGSTGLMICNGGELFNTCNPFEGAITESCAQETGHDGLDNNCDGTVDLDCSAYCDKDGDGYSPNIICALTGYPSGDCDDSDATINPGQSEMCNNRDDDCNPETLDGSNETWYLQETICDLGQCEESGQLECINGEQKNSCALEVPVNQQCENTDENLDSQDDEEEEMEEEEETEEENEETENMMNETETNQTEEDDEETNPTPPIIKIPERTEEKFEKCVADWDCTLWNCVDGRETRSCTDLHSCPGAIRPSESRSCEIISRGFSDSGEFSSSNQRSQFDPEKLQTYALWIFIILVLVLIGVVVFFAKRKMQNRQKKVRNPQVRRFI